MRKWEWVLLVAIVLVSGWWLMGEIRGPSRFPISPPVATVITPVVTAPKERPDSSAMPQIRASSEKAKAAKAAYSLALGEVIAKAEASPLRAAKVVAHAKEMKALFDERFGAVGASLAPGHFTFGEQEPCVHGPCYMFTVGNSDGNDVRRSSSWDPLLGLLVVSDRTDSLSAFAPYELYGMLALVGKSARMDLMAKARADLIDDATNGAYRRRIAELADGVQRGIVKHVRSNNVVYLAPDVELERLFGDPTTMSDAERFTILSATTVDVNCQMRMIADPSKNELNMYEVVQRELPKRERTPEVQAFMKSWSKDRYLRDIK